MRLWTVIGQMTMNEIVIEQPKIRLDFYESAIFLTRFDDGGLTTYPVSVHDVAHACAGIPLTTGLLPPNTLFWERQGDAVTLALFVPARRWHMQLADSRTYHLPMPPFIFTGRGRTYYAYAVKARPHQPPIPLWRMPCPNIHGNGQICPGNTTFPECSAATIEAALQLVMEGSQFNADLVAQKCRTYPDDVRRLWHELDGRPRFPLRQLLPMTPT
jgi:hypothetical protein